MKISAISDVHVKVPNDEADKLLQKFLNNEKVQSSDFIILLGDIFDLMCGPHKAYLEKFEHLFDLIDKLAKEGKKIYFFEGNHDIHLKKLFLMRWPLEEVKLLPIPKIELIDGKIYYFSHGDEHEIDNIEYQKYKSLITSKPLTIVANYLMPYQVLNFLGERASKMSRKRGAKEYNEELVRTRFRNGVESVTEGKYQFILGGHSHVKDIHQFGQDSVYINNGYALKSQTFIHIDNHIVTFPVLS
jgi:UDP-2,3-diacylglucosamine hydrolase